MNILILGNGFDIAHGLPTRYTDFLRFCQDYDSNRNILDNKNVEQEFVGLMRNNVWLSYFLKITNLNEEKTWIDFEKEISSALILFTKTENNHLKRINQNNDRISIFAQTICEKQWNGVREFDETSDIPIIKGIEIIDVTSVCINLYDEIRRFTRAFEIYCCFIINEKSGITRHYKLNDELFRPSSDESVNVDTYVLSFNYTRTFNRYYDIGDSTVSYKYVYPHGEALSEIEYESANSDIASNGLVLGTHSIDRNVGWKGIPPEFNVFQKHNQQHRYGTLSDFQNLLKELRACTDSVNIFVVGHSLDKSDHSKLKHVFCENKDAYITVYYYDENTLEKYINNMTEILGEEEVAIRVRFKHQHNHSLVILLPFNIFEDGRSNYDIIDESDTVLGEIITDYFLTAEMPNDIDELSTHSSIDCIDVSDISKVQLYEDDRIVVIGNGYIEVDLQYGSSMDARYGDSITVHKSYPLNFKITLDAEYDKERTHNDKFLLSDILYDIDTSSDQE